MIPKPIRDDLDIRPGDRVMIDRHGDEVRIAKAVRAEDLRGSLLPSDVDPLAVLMHERARDRDREDRKIGR